MSQTPSAMDPLNTYWTFLNITAAGRLQQQTHPIAQPHFSTHITPLIPTESPNAEHTSSLPHRPIQRMLYTRHLSALKSDHPNASESETCLRCFISHSIDHACQQLASNFGTTHGFTKMDLLVSTLNDDRLLTSAKPTPNRSRGRNRTPQLPNSSYRSLSTQIIDSFEPSASNLKTWTIRLVRQDKDINTTLLEHGVYLVSDWAILNDTREPQLQRILIHFHLRSAMEVQQAALLLESYHTIYRRDRLNANTKGRCERPSPEQLQRIQTHFNDLLNQDQDLAALKLVPLSDINATLHQLQSLAQSLREYRINVRRKTLPSQSLDAPESAPRASQLTTSSANMDDDNTVQDFLRSYRQLFLECLDKAIATVIDQKVKKLGKRKAQNNKKRDQLFVTAFQLYCQGQTMTEIAPQIGYERQDKVTYLLQLKALRTDIRHEMLTLLGDRIQTLAQQFRDPDQLHALDDHINTALDEQVADLMDKAEREATGTREGPLKSLFYQRISAYLERWPKFPR